MIRPLRFLFGYMRLRFSKAAAGEVLNVCHALEIYQRNFNFCGEYACLECSRASAKKLMAACSDRGIVMVSEKEWGIPNLLYRYRHRYGLMVGSVCFALLVMLSSRVVWDVRVEGNERLTDGEVISSLRDCGFGIGSRIRGLDVDALESRVLLYSDEISWVSVNLIGTVANVELRERELIEEEAPDYAAANLVAARGGIVEEFEDVRGNIVVNIGDAVGEGDLLVGGIYGAEGKFPHYTCAKGKIIARTEREFCIEIPLEYAKKQYTGTVKTEKYWIFFEKEVKIFANTGNLPLSCDTIDTVEYFCDQNGVRLPVGIRTIRYYEYETCLATRTEEEARALAEYGLRCQIESVLAEGTLLAQQISWQKTAGGYVLLCRAECLENIALTEEIRIAGLS